VILSATYSCALWDQYLYRYNSSAKKGRMFFPLQWAKTKVHCGGWVGQIFFVSPKC